MRFQCFNAPRRARVLGSLLCTLAAAGCSSPDEYGDLRDQEGVEESEAPVVYGTDNRTDVYAHPNATLRARAQQATVALMEPAMLNTSNPSNVTFNALSLGTAENLCATERFRADPAAAFCSGTLIDDDLVLTAGHCLATAAECSNTRFVFNFYRTGATALSPVTTADIFSCNAIVARQLGEVNGHNLDYAVVRLDRAATPRFTPAPIRAWSSALPASQGVAVIGSGSGIPFKIDSGGAVRTPRAGTLDYFVANTDTFQGNSGSGVYENSGHTLAGILVRGATDYVANGSCNVVNVCAEAGCSGEGITYVSRAVMAYCQVAGSARLCGSGYTTSVFSGPRSNYTISKTGSAYVVKDNVGADGSRSFTSIVRLKFTNAVLAMDINGNAGKAYRMYQAAFDRTPDAGGLGFWVKVLDDGNSLETVAGGFISSQEFIDLYGSNPTNEVFITKLYTNILHRAPDQAGKEFWVTQLNNGVPRAAVLAAFSESSENKAGVLAAISEGITYTPSP